MQEAWLYLAQRLSAVVMAPLVLGHLTLMIYAVQGGLDAGEILSRTRGSIGWGIFYGVFVLAVAIHASIGLRGIIREYTGLRERWLNSLAVIIGLLLLTLGLRAVMAVVL